MTGLLQTLMLGFVLLPLRPPAPLPYHDVFTIMAAFDRIIARPLWPGFDPAHTPIALFDGHDTYLFRHPSPPDGFAVMPDHPGVFRYRGRHESLRASTQVVIGGERTATVILDPARVVSDTDQAATIVHEAFHLFQAVHHPGWQGNEGDLLTYPLDDTLATGLQRLETEALRRAVAASTSDSSACWSRTALRLRHRRFAQLPPASGIYEQRTELNEGLATYVEFTASGRLQGWNIPADGFGPDQVRLRAYATGPALGALLDRLVPGWQQRLDADSAATLDGMLGRSLVGGPICEFTAEEQMAAAKHAGDEVTALAARSARDRDQFLNRPGWTLEVVVDNSEPLWPQAFDPWNLERVGNGMLLHGRWLKLGNKAGSIEVLDRASLTEPAGEHPLFNGVRRLVITGLSEPKPIVDGTTIKVHGEGVDATLSHARAERSRHRVVLHLTG